MQNRDGRQSYGPCGSMGIMVTQVQTTASNNLHRLNGQVVIVVQLVPGATFVTEKKSGADLPSPGAREPVHRRSYSQGWQKPLLDRLGEVVFVFFDQKPLVFGVFAVVFAQHGESASSDYTSTTGTTVPPQNTVETSEKRDVSRLER